MISHYRRSTILAQNVRKTAVQQNRDQHFRNRVCVHEMLNAKSVRERKCKEKKVKITERNAKPGEMNHFHFRTFDYRHSTLFAALTADRTSCSKTLTSSSSPCQQSTMTCVFAGCFFFLSHLFHFSVNLINELHNARTSMETSKS